MNAEGGKETALLSHSLRECLQGGADEDRSIDLTFLRIPTDRNTASRFSVTVLEKIHRQFNGGRARNGVAADERLDCESASGVPAAFDRDASATIPRRCADDRGTAFERSGDARPA